MGFNPFTTAGAMLHDAGTVVGLNHNYVDVTPGWNAPDINAVQPAGTYNAFGKNPPKSQNSPVAAPTAQVIQANPQVTSPQTIASGGTVSGGGTASNPGLDAFLQAAGQQYGMLQGDYNAVQGAQDASTAGINNTYTPQLNTLNTQLAQGQAANAAAQHNLDVNKSIALRDLGDQLRSMYNSYQNQLGVSGAGNSSAANLIGYALSRQANNGRADIGTQYGQQQTGINQNNANLMENYQNQKDALDAWKADQLNKIAIQYGQYRQSIANQMAGVNSDEARTALYMRDQAAANTALDQMKQTVQNYGNAVANLNQQFSNVQHPTADLSKFDQGYQVQQFSPAQLAGMSYQANAAPSQTIATAPIVANLQKNDNQTPLGTVASLNQ